MLASVDATAAALGLRPGMASSQALTLVPELAVVDAEPESDAGALRQLALWCHRYTPLASVCAADGIWLDVGGCSHLFGGEAAMMNRLLGHLDQHGMQAQAAVADTPGAAHAMARHGWRDPVPRGMHVVPAGGQAEALASLPVACLRLTPDLDATLRRLGFDRVGHLGRVPRALLARRFGSLPGLRLDQAHGRVNEPLAPLPPERHLFQRLAFLEPLLTAEALSTATARLMDPLCRTMEHDGLGARQLDLLFERVDGQVIAVRIGTAWPSRDPAHLARMLDERLELVDPGLGVEAMQLIVPWAETLRWEQQDSVAKPQVARLVDRLVNRLGADRVYRISAVESAVPEQSIRRTPAMDPVMGEGWDEAPGKGSHPMAPEAAAQEPNAAATPADRPQLHVVPTSEAPDGETDRPSLPPGPAPVLKLIPGTHDHYRTDVPDHLMKSLARRRKSRQDSLATDPPLLDWKAKYDPLQSPRPAAQDRPDAPAMARLVPARPKSRTVHAIWPHRLQAPTRLLHPPREVTAITTLPEQLPAAFTWRRHRHRIQHVNGPERIGCEWWKSGEETSRDYFLVENEGGQRFWLFRCVGLPQIPTGSWYLHGIF